MVNAGFCLLAIGSLGQLWDKCPLLPQRKHTTLGLPTGLENGLVLLLLLLLLEPDDGGVFAFALGFLPFPRPFLAPFLFSLLLVPDPLPNFGIGPVPVAGTITGQNPLATRALRKAERASKYVRNIDSYSLFSAASCSSIR